MELGPILVELWSKRKGNNFPFLFLKCSHFLHTGGPLQKFKNAFREERENVKRFLKHLFIYSSKWRHSFAVMSLPIKMSVPIKSAFWPREIFCIYVLRTGCIFFRIQSTFSFSFHFSLIDIVTYTRWKRLIADQLATQRLKHVAVAGLASTCRKASNLQL